MANESNFVDDVEVDVEVRDATAPPRLTFAFPGLEDPLVLWERLRDIGWIIPDRPPHPAPEIDWNSPGGSKYHVLEYRVEGFVVTAEEWPRDEVAVRGLDTINVLRRMGVDLHVPVAYLAYLRRNQVAELRSPNPHKRKQRPTRVPRTLLLSKQPYAVLAREELIDVYETAAGPSQPHWYWAESKRPAFEMTRSEAALDEIFHSVSMGWERAGRMEAPPTVEGRDRALRFVVQDVRDGSAMLETLKERVGEDRAASLLMRPLERTGAFDNCLILVAVVPKEDFAELGQFIINHFPDAIGRARRHQPPVASVA